MIKKADTILRTLLMTGLLLAPVPGAAQITFVDEYLSPEIQKTVSLDFQGASLSTVLKILSQQSGMNFVADQSVANRNVNVYLDNVGVWEALEHILEINGLTYEIKAGGKIFTVKELVRPEHELVTRVYQLNHVTVPSHLLNNMLSFDDTLGEDAGGGGEAGGAAAATGGGQTVTGEEGIVAAIEAILSENGSVTEDKRTNSLIITDHPSQFALIEATIARLDVRVPQILIEAEMLDVSTNTADLLGVKWGDTPVDFHGASKQDLFPFDLDDAILDNIAPEANGPGARDDSFEDPRYTTSQVSFTGLSFIIQFLRTQSDTRNLARPRILTLNNQTATIAIRTDEAIGTQLEQTTGETALASVEAERTETGVFLKVTPHANVQTREITMAVEPKVIEARTGATFGTTTFRDPEERGTKSILRILDGDTIIIGGLLRTDVSDIQTKVPILGSIPIMGSAFRHKDKQQDQRELIVFITPHILDEHRAAAEKTLSKQNFAREQDLPRNARWAQVNEDLLLNERYR